MKIIVLTVNVLLYSLDTLSRTLTVQRWVSFSSGFFRLLCTYSTVAECNSTLQLAKCLPAKYKVPGSMCGFAEILTFLWHFYFCIDIEIWLIEIWVLKKWVVLISHKKYGKNISQFTHPNPSSQPHTDSIPMGLSYIVSPVGFTKFLSQVRCNMYEMTVWCPLKLKLWKNWRRNWFGVHCFSISL